MAWQNPYLAKKKGKRILTCDDFCARDQFKRESGDVWVKSLTQQETNL